MSWQEVPRHLQIKYLHAAAITGAQLGRLAAQLDHDHGDRLTLKLLLRRFHGLAAWAGLHGLSAIAVAAQLGEHDCATLAGANVVPEPTHVDQIRALVLLLRQEIHRQRTTGGISEEILWSRLVPSELGVPAEPAAAIEPGALPAALACREPRRRALAVGLLDVEWQRLECLLSQQGFALQAVETCREAGRAFAAGLPEVVIAGAELADGSGVLLTHYLRSLDRGDEPVVVLAGGPVPRLAGDEPAAAGEGAGPAAASSEGARDDSRAAGLGDAGAAGSAAAAAPRLSCDVDAQWHAPIDWLAVTGSLPALIERRLASPRILYLGKEDEEAAAFRALLGDAGYRVRGCRDPRRFAHEVLTSEPELVLMNLPPDDVAAGTADDLVRWLRSDNRCAAVAVLLLDGEEGAAVRRPGAAGTECLARAAAPPVLLAAVAERIEHGRALRRLFTDPATAAASVPARPASSAAAAV